MATRPVVVVTGASAGVGRATVREFASRGAAVALIARGSEGLKGARQDVEQAGGTALELALDVADHEAVEAAARTVEDEFGPIDIWVNNAMVSVFEWVKQMTPEEVKRVTEVTYLGTVYGTMAALSRMLERDRGAIVNVGSALAYRSIPLQAAYCGAKHAIKGFTESLRTELFADGSGVKVTQVHLPALNTPQFHWVRTSLEKHPMPVPPIYQPEVAARAIVHAAFHPERREYWVGAPTALTILANRVIPGLLDRYLGARGVSSQQADFPIEHGREDNLYTPVEEDFGARGEFGDRAKPQSIQAMASRARTALVGAGAVGAAVIGAVLGRSD